MMTSNVASSIVERMNKERGSLINEVQVIMTNKQREIATVTQKLDRYNDISEDDIELARQVKTRKTVLKNTIESLQQEINDYHQRIESIGNTATNTTIENLLDWIYRITQSENKGYLKRIYASVISQITFDNAQHSITIQLRLNQAVIKQVNTYQQEAGVPLTGAPASLLFRELVIRI